MAVLRTVRRRIRRMLAPDDFADAVSFAALPVHSAAPGPLRVHMLWVEGALSQLERLSCASFARHGYEVSLWSYGALTGVPAGVTLRDGREVLAQDRLYRDAEGSLASFSDLFRLRVLALYGGIWSDTDVICLTPSQSLAERLPEGFLVTEEARRGRQVNSNLIGWPRLQRGDFLDLALAVAERYDVTRQNWGDCGPKLFTALAKLYPHLLPPLLEPRFANPVYSRSCPEGLLAPGGSIPAGACFLHCYNERWRRSGADKNAHWPKTSILDRLRNSFGDAAEAAIPATR